MTMPTRSLRGWAMSRALPALAVVLGVLSSGHSSTAADPVVTTFRPGALPVRALAWTADGRALVTGGEEGTVQVWTFDGTTLVEPPATLPPAQGEGSTTHQTTVTTLSVGRFKGQPALLSVDLSGGLKLWTPPFDAATPPSPVGPLAVRPPSAAQVALAAGGKVLIYDAEGIAGNQPIGSADAPDVTRLAWSIDGRRLVAVAGAAVLGWNCQADGTLSPLFERRPSTAPTDLAADSIRLVVASEKDATTTTLRAWPLTETPVKPGGIETRGTRLETSPDGAFAASFRGRAITLLDPAGGTTPKAIDVGLPSGKSVRAIGLDGPDRIAYAAEDEPKRVRLFTTEVKDLTKSATPFDNGDVTRIAARKAGGGNLSLAWSGDDGSARVLTADVAALPLDDAAAASAIKKMAPTPAIGTPTDLAFHPDPGTPILFLATDKGKRIKSWAFDTAAAPVEFSADPANADATLNDLATGVVGAASLLVSAWDDGRVILWPVAGGAPVAETTLPTDERPTAVHLRDGLLAVAVATTPPTVRAFRVDLAAAPADRIRPLGRQVVPTATDLGVWAQTGTGPILFLRADLAARLWAIADVSLDVPASSALAALKDGLFATSGAASTAPAGEVLLIDATPAALSKSTSPSLEHPEGVASALVRRTDQQLITTTGKKVRRWTKVGTASPTSAEIGTDLKADRLAFHTTDELGVVRPIAAPKSARRIDFDGPRDRPLSPPGDQTVEAVGVLKASAGLGRLLLRTSGGELQLWPINPPIAALRLSLPSGVPPFTIRASSWSPAGDRIALSADNGVSLFDLTSTPLTKATSSGEHTDLVTGLAYLTPDLLTSCGLDGRLKLWSPAGEMLAVKSERQVTAADGAKPISLRGLSTVTIPAGSGSAPKSIIAVAGSDKQVRVWALDPSVAMPELPASPIVIPAPDALGPLLSVALRSDGQLAAGDLFGTLSLWKLDLGTPAAPLTPRVVRLDAAIRSIAFHPTDQAILAAACGDGTIRLIRLP